MTFDQFTDAALLQELTDANHSAIRHFLFQCAIEDELDRKRGDKPNPYQPDAICSACQQPWHFATPTGFSDGTTFASMSEYDLMVQHSNYRHSGGDEYAWHVEHEARTRKLIS